MKKIAIGSMAVALVVVSMPTQADAASSYTVKRGDTLWGISQKTNVSVKELMEINKLSSTQIIVGQKLVLKSSAKVEVVDKVHVVKRGDTLWKISRDYNVSVGEITKWNNLKNTNIYVGQKLKVGATSSSSTSKPQNPPKETTKPVAKTYTVKAGDTLWKISRDYNVNVATIQKWNNMKDTVLKIGQVLKVSDGEAPTEKSPAPTTPTVKEALVTASSLYVRQTPGGKSVGLLPNGARVQLGETKGGWTYITYGSLKGWSSNDYLREVEPETPTAPSDPNGKVVVLDPGHGGTDPGAVAFGNNERTLTMVYATKVKSNLERMGYTVHMTRTGNNACVAVYQLVEDLSCRVKKAETTNADAFVSIHFNSSVVSGFNGTSTHVNTRIENSRGNKNQAPVESRKLAESIHARYVPAFGSSNRGIIEDNLYVLNENKKPAVLLEIGFLNTYSDYQKIINNSVQDRVSKAIAEGIHDYFVR